MQTDPPKAQTMDEPHDEAFAWISLIQISLASTMSSASWIDSQQQDDESSAEIYFDGANHDESDAVGALEEV